MMASPKKNVAYEFDIALIDTADTGAFKASPTIAAGDFQVSTDNGAFANLATLPVVSPAASILVKINLSAAEMNGDKINVKAIDAAGNEWDDVLIFIDATVVNVDDIVRSTTPANTLDVSVGGEAGIDWANVGSPTTAVDLSGTDIQLCDTVTTNTDVRGTDSAALASVCTEARLAELDGANLPADVDAILIDTGTTLDTKLNDIQGATFSSATDSNEAIRNRGDAAWTTGAGGSDRLLMVDTTIATLASQTSFTLTAGSADDSAYVNCTIVVEDAATATQKTIGLISAYTGATKTVTLKYDPGVFTMAATDKVYILAENSLKSTDQNRQFDVTAGGAGGIDWANIEGKGAVVDLSATDINLCDTVTTNTDMVGTDSAALASVCTEARLVELDAPNLPTDVAAVKTDTAAILLDTADIQPKIGAPAADLAADIAAVKVDTAAILVDTDTTIPGTITTLQADTDDIQTRLPAALVGGKMDSDAVALSGSTDAADKLEASAEVLITGAAEAGTLSTTQMTTDLTETTDDHFNGRLITWTSGVLLGQQSDITNYAGATGLLTFTAVTEAPSAADTFVIQ